MGGFVTSTAFSAVQYAMDNAHRQDQVKTDTAISAADAQSQADQIKSDYATDERNRQTNLERALATQRARSGAQGTSGGGSSTAALASLASTAAQQNADARDAANQRIDRINDEYSWGLSKSLLDNSYSSSRSALSLMRQGVSGGVSLLDE